LSFFGIGIFVCIIRRSKTACWVTLRGGKSSIVGDTVLDLLDACESVDTAVDGVYRGGQLGVLMFEGPDGGEDLLEHCHRVRRGGSIGGHRARLPLDSRMSRSLGGLMRRVDDEMGLWVIACPISNRGGGRYAGELNATVTR